MAADITFTAAIPLASIANNDLRAQKGKLVQFTATKCSLATATSLYAFPAFVLANAPSSADNVSVLGAPNVAKVIVDSGGATAGQYATVSAITSGACGGFNPTQYSGTVPIGIFLTTVASGSLTDLLLI